MTLQQWSPPTEPLGHRPTQALSISLPGLGILGQLPRANSLGFDPQGLARVQNTVLPQGLLTTSQTLIRKLEAYPINTGLEAALSLPNFGLIATQSAKKL